jgi:hypothetical protein
MVTSRIWLELSCLLEGRCFVEALFGGDLVVAARRRDACFVQRTERQ